MMAEEQAAPPGIVLSGGIRDHKTHAEIFEHGQYADVVFAIGKESDDEPPLEVYGLKPVFCLGSEKFRALIEKPPTYKCSKADRTRLSEVDGHRIEEVTPEAFKVVANYLYKLPLFFQLQTLHQVIEASSFFDLPELSMACHTFGLQQYTEAWLGENEEASRDAMLRCLEAWHHTGAEQELKAEWQKRLLERWPQEAVLGSSVLTAEFSLATMQSLLTAEEMHRDETALWNAVLSWAKTQWELGVRRPSPDDEGDDTGGKKGHQLLVGSSSRLFGPRAYEKPKQRTGPESEWQQLLLPLSKMLMLHRLSPEAFAWGLEGTATGSDSPGLIPELRSMLFAARRAGMASPAKAV